MLLLTTIIYGIAASAVSHSIILSVGKTKAKTKNKKTLGFLYASFYTSGCV